MDIYNSLRERVKILEEEKKNILEENRKLTQDIAEARESIEILQKVNWFDRVFGWKQIKKLTSEKK